MDMLQTKPEILDYQKTIKLLDTYHKKTEKIIQNEQTIENRLSEEKNLAIRLNELEILIDDFEKYIVSISHIFPLVLIKLNTITRLIARYNAQKRLRTKNNYILFRLKKNISNEIKTFQIMYMDRLLKMMRMKDCICSELRDLRVR
jgi:hypothetical protein